MLISLLQDRNFLVVTHLGKGTATGLAESYPELLGCNKGGSWSVAPSKIVSPASPASSKTPLAVNGAAPLPVPGQAAHQLGKTEDEVGKLRTPSVKQVKIAMKMLPRRALLPSRCAARKTEGRGRSGKPRFTTQSAIQ